MELTFVNSLIFFLGMGVTWFILFSLFTEKSRRRVGLKLGILVLMFSPLIAASSYNIYAILSRQLFIMSGVNGEIQLLASPLKHSHKDNQEKYCTQFKDSKGKELKEFTLGDDYSFCGAFWGIDKDDVVFIPYKIIDKDKAIYWASPELKIIGPKPHPT